MDKGEIVALTGRNGAGKSTLLRIVAGLLTPAAGEVAIGGIVTNRWSADQVNRLGVGYLLQEQHIFPTLTVEENLDVAVVAGRRVEGDTGVEDLLSLMPELGELQTRKAGLLSGGERRLLALAMVLSQNPRLLLLDELSTGLARQRLVEVLQYLQASCKRHGRSVLMVEHAAPASFDYVDRELVLLDGQTVSDAPPSRPD